MKYLFVILLFVSSIAHAQLTIDIAKRSALQYHLGSYSYHEQFIGHPEYGAPIVLTADGGAAAFGDGDEGSMLLKLGKTGNEQWKRVIPPKGDERESQSVVQDIRGNFYVFMLVYDKTKYRGGCERVVYVSSTGAILWDKMIGTCELVNSPTISYIRALKDGRIALRGHVVTEKPFEGKDPQYRYWEGWINNKSVLTQKTGDVIDWKKQEWQKLFKPE